MSVHKPFKTTERAIAKRLGGLRLGHLGKVDVQTDWLAVECKHRKTLPAWLVAAVAQAKRHAQGERLPVVVLHVAGERHSNDLIVLTLANFQAYFGEIDQAIGE